MEVRVMCLDLDGKHGSHLFMQFSPKTPADICKRLPIKSFDYDFHFPSFTSRSMFSQFRESFLVESEFAKIATPCTTCPLRTQLNNLFSNKADVRLDKILLVQRNVFENIFYLKNNGKDIDLTLEFLSGFCEKKILETFG